ncbi:hypothetical protein [Dactylosporangium sp. CA-092794]|uniref:hypothetical protein n=1 Tax=Dactylosporangium sp. CA-092794 TaxID=3239929 RepID=UPI003D903BBF
MSLVSRRRALLAASRRGAPLRGGSVDAGLLRECCIAGARLVDPRGLRLRGVHVRGRLDLAGVDVGFPLVFDGCRFDEPLDLTGGSVRALAVTRSPRLPGLLANGLRVGGDLDLSGSRIAGAHTASGSNTARAAVWLSEARIGGRLLCLDTTIDAGSHGAVYGNRVHIEGNVRLVHGFTATGELRLRGARIAGSLDLSGAHLDHDGTALDLGEATIGGGLFLVPHAGTGRAPRTRGRIALGNAGIAGRLEIRDATLERAGQTALVAPRLSVGGPLTLEGACRVGGLDLSHGSFTTVTVGGGCVLAAPGRTALDLTGTEVRSDVTVEPGTEIDGTVRVSQAHIHGNLTLRGVTLRSPRPDGALISGSGVVVDGGVRLYGLRATGGFLAFRGAMIGSAFEAGGAVLDNPGRRTLGLRQAVVKSSVRLTDGFRSNGVVVLNRCVVEGRLNLQGGSFECPGPSAENPAGHAIQAVGATVRAGVYLRWDRVGPSVDFRGLTTTVLDDDPDRWPERFVVSGMTYDRFGNLSWDRAARLRWLRGQAEYDAGPYEQLARVFRRHGYAGDAEAILIERRHRERRAARRHRLAPRAVLDALYGWVVGYGYRPGRTVWLLLALLVAVAASLYVPDVSGTLRATDARGNTYAVDGRLATADQPDAGPPAPDARPSARTPRPDPCGDGQVRCFNPLLYAVDTVVPLISIGQRSTWYPSPYAPHGRLAEWWLNLATLAGWLLSTVFVLSFTRFTRSA